MRWMSLNGKSHSDQRLTDLLLKQVEESDMVRSSRHAAAIFYKNRLISLGNNLLKTHPIMLKAGRNEKALYLHAEIDALVRMPRGYDPSDCSLYVLRLTKGGRVFNSCPCSGCMGYLLSIGLNDIYWSSP